MTLLRRAPDPNATELDINDEHRLSLESGSLAVIATETREVHVLGANFVYQRGNLEDAIVDGEKRWPIARGRASKVRDHLARLRLLGSTTPGKRRTIGHEWLQKIPIATSYWLQAWLAPDEVLLFVLEIARDYEVATRYGERREVPSHFVLTTSRAALCSVSDLGDVEVFKLNGSMNMVHHAGRDDVYFGDRLWQTTLTNEGLYRDALILAHVPPADRFDVCLAKRWPRLNASERSDCLESRDGGDRWFTLTRYALLPGEQTNPNFLTAFLREQNPAAAITWWQRWGEQLDDASSIGLALMKAFAAITDSPAHHDAMPTFGAKIRATVLRQAGDALALERIVFDREYAQLLTRVELREEAIVLVHRLLTDLPAPEQLALVRDEDSPAAPLHQLRRELLQDLSAFPELNAQTREHVLRELHALQPFDLEALHTLADHVTGEAKDRCLTALRFLESANDHPSPTSPPPKTLALSAELRRTSLQHPAGRAETFAKLQSLIATVDIPDHSSLKKYCEPGKDPSIEAALRNACTTLEIPAVEAYVSRGAHSVGIQAHEGKPHFVLIGGDHLDVHHPLFMQADEMQFAIGAELAHLSFGHARVTSREVWMGAFDKGKATLDMALGIVPFLGSFSWGKRLGQITQYLDNRALGKLLERAGKWLGIGSPPQEQHSLDRSVGLIAAHRLMQLSADRVGLLLCGNLGAAFRAMFKTRRESAAELTIARSDGWSAAFARLQQFDDESAQNLRLRCGSLLTFYLSDEYARLREVVMGSAQTPSAGFSQSPAPTF
jgi:hypothetical protein